MHRTVLLLALVLTCTLAPVQAAPKGGKKPALETHDLTVSPQTTRLIEFKDDDLSLALQILAREAKVKIAVSDDLKDTITMRVEDQTPREALDFIIAAKDLAMEKQHGVLFIRSKNPATPRASNTAKADSPDAFKDLATTAFAPALTGLYDALLDYAGKPETAQRLAKATRALYDALIAEGFSKEEAFQIVLSDRGLPTSGSKK
jgi:type II secretory pathway component HofQ